MVQIRQLQPRPSSQIKFWGRVKLRIRTRRRRVRGSLNNPRRIFKDLNSETGRHRILFGLRSLRTRERTGLLGFSQRWRLADPGRWFCLARKKFLCQEGARVRSWLVNNEKRGKEPGKGLSGGSDPGGCRYTERSWGLEKRRGVGRVKITSWMNGTGRRSFRAPLIEDPEEDGEQQSVVSPKWRADSLGEGCCGCTGGMMWRYRDKFRKAIENIVESESQIVERSARPSVDDQGPVLPDDIIEMCLARTPFMSLMRSRAVCKKWHSLTSTPHFFQLREDIRSLDPWLFLFGLSRNGVSLGQIQALDPASSRWHTIKADILTGRISYSLTAANSAVYVVGGYSSTLAAASGRSDKESLKTLKTVLLYTPLTGSWRKVCPLTTERAAPIVGVFALKGRKIIKPGQNRGGNNHCPVDTGNPNWTSCSDCEERSSGNRGLSESRSRRGGELAIYGGAETRGREADAPERAGTTRRTELNKKVSGRLLEGLEGELGNLDNQSHHRVPSNEQQRTFGLIVVGGQGSWNEQLDSAEIYDPVTDNWREIASLPVDHGTPCAGVVCKNCFYVYSESNKLAAYDLDHDIWHSIRVSQAPARLLDYSPKLVSCRGRVFLLGVTWGPISESGSEMATRMIWELRQEPAATGWVNVSQHPDAPLDWNAVFVADEEIIFGVEMFKIFGQMLDFVTVCKISRSGGMAWERGSRMEMAMHEMDPSSCFTKTAVVVRL